MTLSSEEERKKADGESDNIKLEAGLNIKASVNGIRSASFQLFDKTH